MKKNIATPTNDVARSLAEVLKNAGITSDVSEPAPKPNIAAFNAYRACCPGGLKADWDELREWLTAPGVPSTVYFLKMAQLCRRALGRHQLSEEMREPVTYAWGYFAALYAIEMASDEELSCFR